MACEQAYFKTMDEMCKLFKNIPIAIANTIKIADKCNFEFEFHASSTEFFDEKYGIPHENTDVNLAYNLLQKLCYDALPN